MKKKIVLSFLIIFVLVIITGCMNNIENNNGNNSNNKEEPKIEPNSNVGLLKYYIPSDFVYRKDLRGYIYSEDNKKVYIKGDYENDPSNVIIVIVQSDNMGKGSRQYISEINEKLSDNDVKFSFKSNNKIAEIYSRENYIINNKLNYAYVTDNTNIIYTINIQGPVDKSEEISKLVKEIFSSLVFN